MPAGASVKRYAQAAFQLALEDDSLDRWADELAQAAQASTDQEVRTFLEHAKVSTDQKLSLIDQALPNAHPLVRNLLALLVVRGLAGRIPEIVAEYRNILNEHRGRVQVQVTSAVPLEDTQQQNMTRVLARIVDKEVDLITRVDPAILGGLVLMVEDKLIDGSTRAKLNGLGRNMADSGR